MSTKAKAAVLFLALFLLYPWLADSREKASGGMPPANVAVSDVKAGFIAVESELVGTVYYVEVSDVASEVNGKVEKVNFEEGQRTKRGSLLVQLSSDLLERQLTSVRASYEQVLTEKQKAMLDLGRIEKLRRQGSIAETLYDEHRFKVKGLEKKAVSLKADVERIEAELEKKRIRSPFDGVILDRAVDRGEWLSPGSKVATIAKDDVVDVVVNVPEEMIKFFKKGMTVTVKAAGEVIEGKAFAIIPKGDIATRTFPLKIRFQNTASLKEGMEARITLPSGEKEKTFIVPRDALISMYGRTVVFAVIDSKARMIPVEVKGYEGLRAGIVGDGLSVGMQVVTKGNERLRDGQSVRYPGSRSVDVDSKEL